MPRPRNVPEDEALERALLLFWEKGYDRTSIADLSAAIGVGPSSIYNAFGSKTAIFRRALERYMATHAGFVGKTLLVRDRRGAEETLRELLRGAVKLYTSPDLPPGCAMLQGGGSGVAEDSEACAITLELKRDLEDGLRRFLESRGRAGEDFAAPPRILAKFILGTLRGLSQLACDGASRRDLQKIADHAARSCVLADQP